MDRTDAGADGRRACTGASGRWCFCGWRMALNQDRASAVLKLRTADVPEARGAGAGAGKRRSGAGGVVAEEGGRLLSRGLPPGPGGRGGVKSSDGARIEHPLQHGRTMVQAEPGERAFAEPEGGRSGGTDGYEEEAHEGREVRVVTDEENVLVRGALAQQLLEVRVGSFGGQGRRRRGWRSRSRSRWPAWRRSAWTA